MVYVASSFPWRRTATHSVSDSLVSFVRRRGLAIGSRGPHASTLPQFATGTQRLDVDRAPPHRRSARVSVPRLERRGPFRKGTIARIRAHPASDVCDALVGRPCHNCGSPPSDVLAFFASSSAAVRSEILATHAGTWRCRRVSTVRWVTKRAWAISRFVRPSAPLRDAQPPACMELPRPDVLLSPEFVWPDLRYRFTGSGSIEPARLT
jgi:hypothetical protein